VRAGFLRYLLSVLKTPPALPLLGKASAQVLLRSSSCSVPSLFFLSPVRFLCLKEFGRGPGQSFQYNCGGRGYLEESQAGLARGVVGGGRSALSDT